MTRNTPKGFTLIELLIVIGILAVLATVTVLVLNPAELFRQARDSQRLSDLNTLKSAIALYLTTVSSPDLDAGSFVCTSHFGSDKTGVAATAFASGTAASYTQVFSSATTSVDGTGWIPVNLTSMSGGSPIAGLPIDPNRGDATTYYAYACTSSLTFELNAKLESTRYTSGNDDVITTDGGNQTARYETGTTLAM